MKSYTALITNRKTVLTMYLNRINSVIQCINFYHFWLYTAILLELETQRDGSDAIDASICRVSEPRVMYWTNGIRRRNPLLSVCRPKGRREGYLENRIPLNTVFRSLKMGPFEFEKVLGLYRE